jgi:hypothetical protein
VRHAIARSLEPAVTCVELGDVAPIPASPDLSWRQRSTEQVVRLALDLQTDGRRLLLSGDPVAPGELLAAPSADRLDAVAICLLDCRPDAQRERLRARGEPPVAIPHHLAFAEWMRGHVQDPAWRPEVVTTGGWDEMRWERWAGLRHGDARWRFETIDTSDLAVDEVAAGVLAWARAALSRGQGSG